MGRVLITGITGQDGAYLSKLLVSKGHEVLGTTRSYNRDKFDRLEYLGVSDKVKVVECDLLDFSAIHKILKKYRPSAIYNLAAQSSVAKSFNEPIGTMHFNVISVLNLLESIKLVDEEIFFYQASSSEIFGKVECLPINHKTPKHPLSPYAISKASAYWSTVNYRESFGIKACSGILFNHESPLRASNFFTKKIVQEALEVKYGKRKEIVVGDIDIFRDMGSAEEYVEAMTKMIEQENMSDYLICSGKPVSLRSLVEYIFEQVGIGMEVLKQDEKFFRPNEIKEIYGDPQQAREELGWSAQRTIYDVLDEMIGFERSKKSQ